MTALDLQLDYAPFPKQQAFHANPAKYRLFGGAAGPGKTKALLMEAVLQANEHANVNTLLLRRTMPELEQSLILEFKRSIPRDLYRSFNESKHQVEWHNGSITKFGAAQHEKDIEQYYGAEWLFIGLDELTTFTLYQWMFLTSRNRCAVPSTFPNMAGTSNPGSIGHKWVKLSFGCFGPGERPEKKAPPGMDVYDPSDYAFIPARVEDNPIYANDPSYLKTMAHLPKRLRDALRLGLWEAFAGQYFDVFDPAVNVRQPHELNLQPWNPRWISIDWGRTHPAAVYWHALRDDGVTVTSNEFVQAGLSPRMLAEGIVEREDAQRSDGPATHQRRADVSGVYLSPDAFAKRTSEATIAEQIGDVLARAGLPRPTPADDDRIGGWTLMHQMIESRMWEISSRCSELLDRIPQAIHDDKKPEDVAKFDAVEGQGGDDPLDAARYGLKSRHSPSRKPPADIIREQLAEIDDPTSRAIHAQKLWGIQAQKEKPYGRLRWMRKQ